MKKAWYTVKELRSMLGVGSTWIDGQIKAGAIKVAQATPNSHRLVSRAEAVRLCLDYKVPTETMRRHLNGGKLALTCGVPPGRRWLSLAGLPAKHTDTLFELGRLVDGEDVWAVVCNVEVLGGSACHAALSGFSTQPDRPHLVGLVGGADAAYGSSSASVFDVVWPAAAEPQAIADMLARLRRSQL